MPTSIEIQLDKSLPRDVVDAIRKNLYWTDRRILSVEVIVEAFNTLVKVTAESIDDSSAFSQQVQQDLNDMADSSELFSSKTNFVHTRKATQSPPTQDPFRWLITEGQIVQEAVGTFIYFGMFARLCLGLDRYLSKVAFRLGAAPAQMPSLLSTSTLAATGYLSDNAYCTNFVFRLLEGREVLNSVKVSPDPVGKQHVDLTGVDSTSGRPEAVLAPAVCHSVYRAVGGQQLNSTLFVTGYSRSYRYESRATNGVRRLREFGVRELVCISDRDEVQDKTTKFLRAAETVLASLDLDAEISTASDAFFPDRFARFRNFQMSFASKYEVVANIPWDNSGLAIASVNFHGEHFGSTWKIVDRHGKTAVSCCMGFGIERCAYAILAQHGTDVLLWPPSVKALLED